jgi:hypothetical protein
VEKGVVGCSVPEERYPAVVDIHGHGLVGPQVGHVDIGGPIEKREVSIVEDAFEYRTEDTDARLFGDVLHVEEKPFLARMAIEREGIGHSHIRLITRDVI